MKVVQELRLTPGDQFTVDINGDQIVLSREESLTERRLHAILEVAGSLPGAYEPGQRQVEERDQNGRVDYDQRYALRSRSRRP